MPEPLQCGGVLLLGRAQPPPCRRRRSLALFHRFEVPVGSNPVWGRCELVDYQRCKCRADKNDNDDNKLELEETEGRKSGEGDPFPNSIGKVAVATAS